MNRLYCHRIDLTSPMSRTKISGFSLLEVMVALIVLSVGLLGIAGLQTFSLQFNHQSYERTQATILTSEIFDRIMANPAAAKAGIYDNVAATDTSANFTGFGACATTGCANTNDLATFDIYTWKKALENSKMTEAQGSIVRQNPGDDTAFVYVITINWVENNIPTQQTMTVRSL